MKSSCGSDTRHSCSTVRPPTPESKTATGSYRPEPAKAAYGRRPRGRVVRWQARVAFAPLALPSSRESELHLADRLLDLADDHVAELLALVRSEALHRRDHSRHHERDEQDQRYVLDRALAAGVQQAGVDSSEEAMHGYPLVRWGRMLRAKDIPLQTRVSQRPDIIPAACAGSAQSSIRPARRASTRPSGWSRRCAIAVPMARR